MSNLFSGLGLGRSSSLGSSTSGVSGLSSINRDQELQAQAAQSVNINPFPPRPATINDETASKYFQDVAAHVGQFYVGSKGLMGNEAGAVNIAANNLPRKEDYGSTEGWVEAIWKVQSAAWYLRVKDGEMSSGAGAQEEAYNPTRAALKSLYDISKSQGPVGHYLEQWANRGPDTGSSQSASPGMSPAGVVSEALHQSTQDYLNTVRSRLVVEKGLDDILAGEKVVLPATSPAGIKQWQQTFGADVAYNSELVKLLFKHTQGTNGQITSEAVAPEDIQYSGNDEQLKKTLQWYQQANAADRKRFLDAVLLTASWEEAVEKERIFLADRAAPLAENWDRQVPRDNKEMSEADKNQRTNILGSLEQHNGNTERSQALDKLVGQQIVADIKAGPGNAVLLEQREIAALKALHGSLGLSTPFEQISEEQAVALVNAALYLGRHWSVVEAEAKGDAAEIQRAKAIRDDAKAVPDLTALGVSPDAAIATLQRISPALMSQNEVRKELVDIASGFNFQGPLVERLLDIFELRRDEVR